MKHKPLGRKLLSMLLALLMLLSLLPVSALAADSHQFALLAVNSNEQIIAPCYVTYQAGDTIKDALKRSGHTFVGIDEGYITAIDGKDDSYLIHYDGDNYDLSKPASEVTALWFTTNAEQTYGEHLLETVLAMAKFNTSTNGVKDYAAAKDAYEAACDGFFSADNTAAAKLAVNLNGAMQRYEDSLTGKTVAVTLDVTLDGTAVTPDHVELTSEFGHVVTAEKTSTVQLIPGTYTYEITHDTFRHVRGTVDITGPATLTAQLPAGQWIQDVTTGLESDWAPEDEMPRDNVTSSGGTYYIPDYAEGKLFSCVVPGNGVDTSDISVYAPGNVSPRPWNSKAAVTTNAYAANSLEDATIVYEARSASNEGSYQTYTMRLVRTPSLQALSVLGDGTALSLDFHASTKSYSLSTTSNSLTVSPTALCADVAITVNGKTVQSGKDITVALNDCTTTGENIYQLPIQLTAPNGQESLYTLSITKLPAVEVSIQHETSVSVEVFTDSGTSVAPQSATDTTDVYALIPGNNYKYVSTKDTYYHACADFTAAADQTITAVTPKSGDWLASFSAKSSFSAPDYPITPDYTAATHEYSIAVESNSSGFYTDVTATDPSAYTVTAFYTGHPASTNPGVPYSRKLDKSINLVNFLTVGGVGNNLRLEVKEAADNEGVTYYQDYFIHVHRSISLNTLSVADNNGAGLALAQKDAPDTTKFNKNVLDYTVSLGQLVPEMQVSFKLLSFRKIIDTDFIVKVACGDWSQELICNEDVLPNVVQTVTVPLDTAKDKETITVTVSHKEADSIPQTYTIELHKLPPVVTAITVDPADAVIFLQDDTLKTRVLPEADGQFILNTGVSYTYSVTKNGYVGQTKSFTAGEDNSSIQVKLEKAPESTLTDLTKPGDWHQFRADSNNNGVVDVKTPIKAEDTTLVWANKIGEGYGSGAVGCPIIVGGYLYTYAGKSIVKVDKETGEVMQSGEMVANSSFAINSPTYADGMIFVGLSNGRVQAFNAETLESLWIYTDPLKGQPNCPISYADGYIYTGFWNSETRKANFVCLSITDEDPTKPDEAKIASWTHTDKGFYWAGAYMGEKFLLVPTDDGANGYITGHGDLLSLDPNDGKIIDCITMPGVGDLRSSICYDETTKAYYFTSKGGDFYQIRVNADGTFVKDSLRKLHLDNGADDPSTPPMSTSTPVIYKGRAYIGVSGTSQFGQYSGHNMTVIDLNSFSIAYTVATQGYPQVSGLITTAYEESGYIYVYFIDNYTPGKIRVIRDQPGRTTPDPEYLIKETYQQNGQEITVDAGYVLFTPSGNQAQYAICSPIVDPDGNIYFKNDSAQLMCLSSVITHLEITQQPEHLTYEVGQTFDGKGLRVSAHYANGLIRDITDYISFTSEPLTVDDTEITISYDPDKQLHNGTPFWQFYQNKDGVAGVPYDLPTATVNITVTAEHNWDDGSITKEPTCTEPGEILYTCTTCGQTKSEVLPLAGHTLTHIPAKAPTCTEDGNVEYYHCSVCEKNFADADGSSVLDETTVKATGHTLTRIPAKAPTCTEDGNVEYYHCSVCEKNFADADGSAVLDETTVKAAGHTLTRIPAKAPTCTEDGNVEYYHCSVCEKNFADAEGSSLLDETTVKATGHTLIYIEEVPATEKAEGVKAHWQCNDCHKLFADKDGLQEVSSDDLVLAKLNSPATGDRSYPILFAAATVGSLLALTVFVTFEHKKKHAKK